MFETGSMNSGENEVNMQKKEVQTLPPRYGSGECSRHDVLDAADGDAHCRWCGAIIPTTNYVCAVSQRCCSAVCQALYGEAIGWFVAPIDETGTLNRSELKRLLKEHDATMREKLIPDWFAEKEKNRAEDAARDRVASLRSQAKALGVLWPRDWQKAGWKSEKRFLADMGARIASRIAPVAESSLLEAA
jgi:hypothetical protein